MVVYLVHYNDGLGGDIHWVDSAFDSLEKAEEYIRVQRLGEDEHGNSDGYYVSGTVTQLYVK